MLMIRLQRTGKRGQAYFRVVVVEHTKKAKGEYLELLGSYNPHQKEFKVKKDRVEDWISKGAQISPTVNNLMVNYKVWDRPKMQSWKPKKRDHKSGENKETKAENLEKANKEKEVNEEKIGTEPEPSKEEVAQ